MTTGVIDSDQHLYEPRTMWADHIDPAHRADALSLEDDDLGYTWLMWRGRRLQVADVHQPGDTESCGTHRQRLQRGEPASYSYDETVPASYWHPSERVGWLDEAGLDAAVCFPNFGLLWERTLSSAPEAMLANMGAWNRWCASIIADGRGRLHPVAHLSLHDATWVEQQLSQLSGVGVKVAMIAPAPINGKAMSHPDNDRLWAAFVANGITPVFHVADQPRVFDDCWYTEPDAFVPVVESAFLWVPPALAITDLILNGAFDRHPGLRIGIVELSSIWVPQFMLMLDGAFDFTSKLNGRPIAPLRKRPHEYLLDHVRIASFSYENPRRLADKSGDIFMACSDFPHSEGTASPLADYERAGLTVPDAPLFFRDNVSFMLGD